MNTMDERKKKERKKAEEKKKEKKKKERKKKKAKGHQATAALIQEFHFQTNLPTAVVHRMQDLFEPSYTGWQGYYSDSGDSDDGNSSSIWGVPNWEPGEISSLGLSMGRN